MRFLVKELIFRCFFFTQSGHDHSGGHPTVVKGGFNGAQQLSGILYS